MPRDTSHPPPPRPSLAAMFAARDDAADDTEITVAGLPPTSAPAQRTRHAVPVADLGTLARSWLLIGAGGSGKTVLARYLAGELMQRGMLDQVMLAALDPANRTLATFFEGVQQPPSSNPAEVVGWLRSYLAFLAKQRLGSVTDFGGGDTSLARLIEQAPGLAGTMEGEGVALIACYVLTPRVDDLASLVTFAVAGFRPRATALVLNLGRAENRPAAFDAMRRSTPYKAAIAQGAVELWLPALDQATALRIERARAQFHDARDGTAPEGRRPAALGPLERLGVRSWLEAMGEEMRVVEGWMPWAT